MVFSWPATVITATVMAFPLIYMTARGAFEQVDTNIEDAARTLGVKRQYKVLFLGVLLSSLVFDGIFIILGLVVGANTLVKPTEMILFSLVGLTGLYVVIFVIRQTSRFIKSRWIARYNQSK